jgi:hypothetical protein
MAAFGKKSRAHLDTCDERLQRLFGEVVKRFDCSVIDGHRGEERQNALYNAEPQRSKVQWPNGKHNKQPSLAADVVPYPVNWNDIEQFYYFAGYVKGVASQMGISIRWGGDWDQDNEVGDEGFKDLPHFEIG